MKEYFKQVVVKAKREAGVYGYEVTEPAHTTGMFVIKGEYSKLTFCVRNEYVFFHTIANSVVGMDSLHEELAEMSVLRDDCLKLMAGGIKCNWTLEKTK
jgi:hypothetical protein